MDALITQLLAQVTASGGIATGVTQFFKVLETLPPTLARIPYIGTGLAWLVDTITPEDPAAIRIFNYAVAQTVTFLLAFAQTGQAEVDIAMLLTGLAGFLQSQGLYILFLKKGKKPTVGKK